MCLSCCFQSFTSIKSTCLQLCGREKCTVTILTLVSRHSNWFIPGDRDLGINRTMTDASADNVNISLTDVQRSHANDVI